MSRILILSRLTMLENARKQVFHVVVLLTLTVVCGSTLLSFFTMGVQVKILKDLCMTSILFCGGMLAVVLASTAIQGEVETRTCYPVLARPVKRADLLLGKYFGTLATVYLGLCAIAVAFTVLLALRNALDAMLLVTLGFTFLEVAVVAALALCLSVFATPAIACMASFLIFVAGTVKIGYFGPLIERVANPAAQAAARTVYHLLPNLESFNFKDALVHHIHVPETYLAQVALYGICYIGLMLTAASWIFSRKEL
ncbi:MAG: ABC transporter permease subunit [Armatimonadetes bacterium]|nr:ABC transporter permease subunit [Armatimonadota bacterium]